MFAIVLSELLVFVCKQCSVQPSCLLGITKLVICLFVCVGRVFVYTALVCTLHLVTTRQQQLLAVYMYLQLLLTETDYKFGIIACTSMVVCAV